MATAGAGVMGATPTRSRYPVSRVMANHPAVRDPSPI
jgi:hypothetical protein